MASGNAENTIGLGMITGGDAIDCGSVLNAVVTIHTKGSR